MQKKIAVIDFLRGYSILLIVIYHIGQAMKPPPLVAKMISFGGTGVHTFIFISGFGLYLSHLYKPLPYWEFLKKRFSRIYIPYVVIVCISALVALFLPVYPNSAYAFFGHLLLYKMFDDKIIGSYGYQLWFISTIVEFYLIFPLLVWVKQRVPDLMLFLIGLAISVGWALTMLWTGHVNRGWGAAFPLYIWEFLLGMIFAERFYSANFRFWEIRVSYLILLAVVGIAGYALMALYLGKYGSLLNDVPALIGFTALSILIYRLGIGFVNRGILWIARIAYPLYLIHFLVLRVVVVVLQSNNLAFGWVAAVVTLGLCFLAALGFDRLYGKVSDSLFRRRQLATGG